MNFNNDVVYLHYRNINFKTVVMKKTNRIFNTISLGIVVLVAIGMAGTFLSDYLVEIKWFGDYEVFYSYRHGEKNVTVRHYGARHYWYNWGVGLLFTSAVGRVFAHVVNIIEEK